MTDEIERILSGEGLSPEAQRLADSYEGNQEWEILDTEGYSVASEDLPQELRDETVGYLDVIRDFVDEINGGVHNMDGVSDEEVYENAKDSVQALVNIQEMATEVWSDGIALGRKADITSGEEAERYNSASKRAEAYASVLANMQNIIGPQVVAPSVMKVANENNEVRMKMARDEEFMEMYPRTLANYTETHSAL